jgi:hypothetical protein
VTTTSYRIPSHKTPGTYYTVTVFGDGDTRCDCPDATYRKRQCKHQRQVIGGFIPAQPVAEPQTAAADIAWQNEGAYLAGRARDIAAGW